MPVVRAPHRIVVLALPKVYPPPGDWLIGQRVEFARDLLESSDLAVDHVARRAGFGGAASLRGHFHAAVGVSPQAYRRTFRVSAGAEPR